MRHRGHPFRIAHCALCIAFAASAAGAATVTLLQNDAENDPAYCFSFGDHWSDGQPPSPGNDYYADAKTIRVYAPANSVFAGDSLTQNSESGKGSYLRLHGASVTFTNYVKSGAGNLYVCNNFGTTAYLRGRIRLGAGTTYFYSGESYTERVEAEIEGGGAMVIQHASSANIASTFWLLGLNTNFTGRLVMNCNVDNSLRYAKVCFNDPRSLGGPMAAWTFNGHSLCNYTRLTPHTSMTLDRVNCGLYVQGQPSYVCWSGQTQTLLERITWNGTLKIIGGGRFALGGDAPFFETDGGTTPKSGKNVLHIDNGILVPKSSEAFQGVNVRFAAGKGVEMAVPAASGSGLGRYGMRNTLVDTPFTLDDGVLRVTIVEDAQSPRRHGAALIPICTVTPAAAAALRGNIEIVSEPYGVKDVAIREKINGDGSVTFVAVLGVGRTVVILC